MNKCEQMKMTKCFPPMTTQRRRTIPSTMSRQTRSCQSRGSVPRWFFLRLGETDSMTCRKRGPRWCWMKETSNDDNETDYTETVTAKVRFKFYMKSRPWHEHKEDKRHKETSATKETTSITKRWARAVWSRRSRKKVQKCVECAVCRSHLKCRPRSSARSRSTSEMPTKSWRKSTMLWKYNKYFVFISS